MKLIPLSNSHLSVMADDDDYENLSKWTWYLERDGSASRRRSLGDGSRTNWIQKMHREICNLSRGDKRVVDHVNGNRLDNQKENLRVCLQADNVLNSKVRKHSKTGLKGVGWNGFSWLARIRHNGKAKHLGSFETADLAYEFVCLAREMLHGEFARHG